MKHNEDILQANCVKWFRYQYPKLTLFSIPNGGNRNIREAVRLKSTGVLAGVADLFLMKANNSYNGLFIEMKVAKGKQSVPQNEFELKAKHENYQYIVCRSFDEFKITIENYLNS